MKQNNQHPEQGEPQPADNSPQAKFERSYLQALDEMITQHHAPHARKSTDQYRDARNV